MYVDSKQKYALIRSWDILNKSLDCGYVHFKIILRKENEIFFLINLLSYMYSYLCLFWI